MSETILQNMPGNQEVLNQLYTSPKQAPAQRNYLKQSLCWTCARARALPDPEGCAFHRREHEHVYDQAEYAYNKDGDRVVSVTECQRYAMTGSGLYQKEQCETMRGRNRHNAELNRREVVRMWQEGSAQTKIAEIVGVHVHTVSKYIQEYQRRAMA